jgi:hypothetical protein
MKSRLILVVAASALLASCGSQVSSLPSATSSAPADSGTVSSSPSASTESGTASTSVPSAQENVDLKAVLAACQKDNGRVVTTINGVSSTLDYYGSIAIYNEDGDNAKTGYIVNGTQGLFEFSVENDAVVLGQAVSAKTSILTATYTLADLAAASLSDFTSTGVNAYTVEVGEEVSDTATALYGVCGLSFDYLSSSYITAPLAVSVTADSLTCSFKISNTSISFVVKDLNKVALPFVDAYVKNPVVVAAPTAYNAAIVAAEAQLFGEGLAIPFPTGIDGLFRQDVSYSDDDPTVATGFALTEFGKDISSSYIAQLKAAGYTETVVTTIFGEYTAYQKQFSEQSETAGAKVIVITCSYDSDYDETDISVSVEVLPVTHEDTDLTRANALLTAYNTAALSIPLLPASEKITNVKTENSAPNDGSKLGFDATLSIAAEADADAYAAAYDKLILAAGFTADSEYVIASWSSNGYLAYTNGDVSVSINEAWNYASESDNIGSYGGSLTFSFVDSTVA